MRAESFIHRLISPSCGQLKSALVSSFLNRGFGISCHEIISCPSSPSSLLSFCTVFPFLVIFLLIELYEKDSSSWSVFLLKLVLPFCSVQSADELLCPCHRVGGQAPGQLESQFKMCGKTTQPSPSVIPLGGVVIQMRYVRNLPCVQNLRGQ